MAKIYIVPTRTAGLNNVKMVIFGMKHIAKKSGARYRLPESIFDFTPTKDGIGTNYIATEEIFDWSALRSYFIESCDELGDLIRLGNADYLEAAKSAFDDMKSSANIITSSEYSALSAFKPSLHLQSCIDTICAKIPSDSVGLQLRIERDWLEYAEKKGWKNGLKSQGREIVLDHCRIFQKIASSDLDIKNLYVCCDEDDLPVNRSQIEADALRFGLQLIFKSDFISPFLPRIKKSVIDFGVCLNLNTYIGTYRSTFSNILCINKSSIALSHANHYLFDVDSEKVEPRTDFGLI